MNNDKAPSKVSKSFTFDPVLWRRVEDARFKYRYSTITDLVVDALIFYLHKINYHGEFKGSYSHEQFIHSVANIFYSIKNSTELNSKSKIHYRVIDAFSNMKDFLNAPNENWNKIYQKLEKLELDFKDSDKNVLLEIGQLKEDLYVYFNQKEH